ncbi:MAG TPA: hypothetical protein VF778_12980 [Xanthobacteraceae bacterium]
MVLSYDMFVALAQLGLLLWPGVSAARPARLPGAGWLTSKLMGRRAAA